MAALFSRMQARGVAYVFPHVIPFNAAGRLPVHSRPQMRSFLATARRVSPGLKVLPWVGGVRVGYRRTRTGTVDLGDLGQRQRIVAECRGLVDEGFDGIHVNIEPVNDGNDDFLALLRALRTAVGHDRILSLSAIRPAPYRAARGAQLRVEHRLLPASGPGGRSDRGHGLRHRAPHPGLYRRYVAYAAEAGTAAILQAGSRARLLLGVPTYDETGLMHRCTAWRRPENAILGIVAGLRGLGGGGTFEGVALYAEWTTDADEWSVYEKLWRGKADARGGSSCPRGSSSPASFPRALTDPAIRSVHFSWSSHSCCSPLPVPRRRAQDPFSFAYL